MFVESMVVQGAAWVQNKVQAYVEVSQVSGLSTLDSPNSQAKTFILFAHRSDSVRERRTATVG